MVCPRPTGPGGMRSLISAERLARLMTEGLGYDRYLISGGQSPEAFERALRTIAAEAAAG